LFILTAVINCAFFSFCHSEQSQQIEKFTEECKNCIFAKIQFLHSGTWHFCKNTIFALRFCTPELGIFAKIQFLHSGFALQNLAFLQKYNFCTPELAKIHSRYKYLSANNLNKSNLFYSDFNRLTVSDCSSYFATVPNSGVQKFQIVPECKNCICIALRIQLELDIC